MFSIVKREFIIQFMYASFNYIFNGFSKKYNQTMSKSILDIVILIYLYILFHVTINV